jgi:hypothetical protein
MRKLFVLVVAAALSVAMVVSAPGEAFAASPDGGLDVSEPANGGLDVSASSDGRPEALSYEPDMDTAKYVKELVDASLLTSDVYNSPFNRIMLRDELAKYAVAFYAFLGGPDPGVAGDNYLDTADPDAEKAYALGLFDYNDGYFEPGKTVSKADMLTVLAKAVIKARPSEASGLPTADAALAALSLKYADANSVYADDLPYYGFMDSRGALLTPQGVLPGRDAYLHANNIESKDRFFLLLSDAVWAFAKSRVEGYATLPPDPKASNPQSSEYQSGFTSEFKNDVYLEWVYSPGAYSYDISVYISKKLKTKLRTGYPELRLNKTSTPTYESVFGNPKQKKACYLKVRAVDRHGVKSAKTLKVNFYAEKFLNMNHKLFGDKSRFGFKSAKAAKKYQKTISVKVWKLSGGKKVKSTMWLTVNKELADDVKQIFNEIYKGKEKFPIKVMGGFQIRESKTSEHNYGTAIDINPTENCMKDGKKVVAGEFWRPGKNKYSIKPDGDVVKAFEKYGWYWGGNGWGNRKDYMHFSYLGT